MVLKFHLLISIHKTRFYLDERFEDLPTGGIFPFDGAAEQGQRMGELTADEAPEESCCARSEPETAALAPSWSCL